jgi:hypothetical protein
VDNSLIVTWLDSGGSIGYAVYAMAYPAILSCVVIGSVRRHGTATAPRPHE